MSCRLFRSDSSVLCPLLLPSPQNHLRGSRHQTRKLGAGLDIGILLLFFGSCRPGFLTGQRLRDLADIAFQSAVHQYLPGCTAFAAGTDVVVMMMWCMQPLLPHSTLASLPLPSLLQDFLNSGTCSHDLDKPWQDLSTKRSLPDFFPPWWEALAIGLERPLWEQFRPGKC